MGHNVAPWVRVVILERGAEFVVLGFEFLVLGWLRSPVVAVCDRRSGDMTLNLEPETLNRRAERMGSFGNFPLNKRERRKRRSGNPQIAQISQTRMASPRHSQPADFGSDPSTHSLSDSLSPYP